MRSNFLDSLIKEASQNPNLMLLTADLGYGVFEEFENNFPTQYLNTGVAEQLMTGVATGLALEGKIVFTYSIANFSTLRCLEQIRNDAAYHEVNVNIIASGGGFSYGQLGMSHHATEDLGVLRALPGIEIFSPCSEGEAGFITSQVISRNGVSYIRLDKSAAPENDEVDIFEIGKLRRFRSGSDVLVIGTGGIVNEALLAAEQLKKENISVAVYACHSLKPFDRDKLLNLSKDFSVIVSLEEHSVNGGLGSLLAETLMEDGSFNGKFLRVGLNDTYCSVVGDQSFLRAHYGIDSTALKTKILSIL